MIDPRSSPHLLRPSWAAALWFGAWGAIVAASIFARPALEQGLQAILLYVLLPGLAAAVAGAVTGARLLNPGGRTSLKAAALGVLIAIEAHVILAPMFAAYYWLTDEAGRSNLWGLMLGTLVVGFLATAPLTLPLGALFAWLLHLFAAGKPAQKE